MRKPPFRLVLRSFAVRELREAASYKVAFALSAGGLLFALTALYYLSRFVAPSSSTHLASYGSDYLGFVVLGFVVTELQQVAVGAFAGRIRSAQLEGTLEAMLATRARPAHILLASAVGDFMESWLRALGYLALAFFGFGFRFHSAHLVTALVALVVGMGSFMGLGLLAAALTMLLRKGDPIHWAVSGLSLLTGGVIYPTSVLPGWLRRLGEALPFTHALEALRRALLGGAGFAELRGTLLMLGALCVVLVPLGMWAFGAALRRAKMDGSLTHY